MAFYNYFPTDTNGSPGAEGSRSSNGYRGKKGRGGHYNGNGRGRNNFYDISNDWRTPSYEAQNYGPRAVPNAPPQGPPAPWGGSGYPVLSHVGGSVGPPSINAAVTTGVPDQAPASDQPTVPHASIAIRTQAITMPSPDFTSSKVTNSFEDIQGAPSATATSDVGHTAQSPSARTTFPQQPQFFTPIPHSAQRSLQRRITRKQGPEDSQEALNFPIDELHQKTQDRLEAISRVPYMLGLEETVARNMEIALKQARETHQAHEDAHQNQRSVLLDQLSHARDTELRHDARVSFHYNKFVIAMKQAAKLVHEESKSAAQLEATRWLQIATEASNKAKEARQIIEQCRGHLLHLDDARVTSANTYTNTVQEVVAELLGSVIKHRTGSTHPAASDDATSGLSQDVSTLSSVSFSPGTPPTTARQVFSQSVIEHHPEQEHQSIEEVLEHMKDTEERIGLTESMAKKVGEAGKGQLNGETMHADAKEAEVGSQVLQESQPQNSQNTQEARKDIDSKTSAAKEHGVVATFQSPAQPNEADSTTVSQFIALAEPIKQDLEYRLRATGPESIVTEAKRKEYAAWVTTMEAAEFPDPLVATAMHAMKDDVVSLLARHEVKMKAMEKDRVSIKAEGTAEEESAAEKTVKHATAPGAGASTKAKKKSNKKKKQNDSGGGNPGGNAGTNGNTNAGSSTTTTNGDSKAEAAPTANGMRKGG